MGEEEHFMRRALALARRGAKTAAPNPMVGCVVVSQGRVVGEGYHRRFGGPHAEVYALRAAGAKARGSTVYVTLEPCSGHPGKKTPPCAPALIEAKVGRVIAAMKDPNPLVCGRGLAQLRRAAIPTRVGLCAADAEILNRPFVTRMKLNRPYIILKTALSLDGKAAAASGRSRWITGPAARRWAHKLRAQADAVLVGVGTVLADDPALTSHGAGKNPVRVVLDTRLRTPKKSRLLDGSAPTWIFTASSSKIKGAETIRVPAEGRRVDLRSVVKILARRGISTLLIEGGPTVHASFLAHDFVDKAFVFLAPKLISGARDPNRAPRLGRPRFQKVGADFLVSGDVAR